MKRNPVGNDMIFLVLWLVVAVVAIEVQKSQNPRASNLFKILVDSSNVPNKFGMKLLDQFWFDWVNLLDFRNIYAMQWPVFQTLGFCVFARFCLDFGYFFSFYREQWFMKDMLLFPCFDLHGLNSWFRRFEFVFAEIPFFFVGFRKVR